MQMLHLFFSVSGEFQVLPIGLEYELKHVESFAMDPVDANICFILKRCQGRHFGTCGYGLSVLHCGKKVYLHLANAKPYLAHYLVAQAPLTTHYTADA